MGERDSTENIDHNSLHDLDNSESDDEISSESQTLAEKEEDQTEEEVSEDIGILMQEVELQLNTLSDEQMEKLQGLLKEHYAGNIEERDNMLDLLIKGDETVRKLVDLVKQLEEKGAKINLLDEDDMDKADGGKGETNEDSGI